MSISTTLSRLTGFVRSWSIAAALGVSAVASAYNISNNIPNMIFELIAGGILSSLLIPSFMEVKEERGEVEAWKFASHIFNLSVLALGIVAVVGTILPSPFIWTQTFGMDAQKAALVRGPAVFLFRLFAIQVVVYGGGMVVQAMLNAQRKYLWTALGPVFNNIVVIATMAYIMTRPTLDTTALFVMGIGTTLGVVAMFAVMVPSLAKTGFKYTFGLGLTDPALKAMLRLAVPTVIYVITNLVAVSFRNSSALSVSVEGSSILSYAWMWYMLPYGILAVALATAVFTELSTFASKKDMVGFKTTLSRGLRSTALLIIPCAAMVYALATPLCSFFVAGRFTNEDVAMVASVLRMWAIALSLFACMMFMLRSFYSLKDTSTPAWTNLGASVIQIGGYLLFTRGFGSWVGLGLNGIPLADACFYALEFCLLVVFMRRRIGSFDIRGFLSVCARMIGASIVGAYCAWWIAQACAPVASGMLGAILQVCAGGLSGLFITFALALLLRVDEITTVKELVVRKFGSRKRV